LIKNSDSITRDDIRVAGANVREAFVEILGVERVLELLGPRVLPSGLVLGAVDAGAVDADSPVLLTLPINSSLRKHIRVPDDVPDLTAAREYFLTKGEYSPRKV
jgi:hypothetical protein